MAFVDHGEFEAMKTAIGRRDLLRDEDQFRDGEYFNCLRDIVVEDCGRNKPMTKMALSLPYTFAFSCLPRDF